MGMNNHTPGKSGKFSACVPGWLLALQGGFFMRNVPRIAIPVHMHEILQLHCIIHTWIRWQ
jgi:hypothetical protein